MTTTRITLDSTLSDRLDAEARRNGVPVGVVVDSMRAERARARGLAELDAAVASTSEPLMSGYVEESEAWEATSEDGR